ncbi:queuosine 5'-phosphate N-glycosylase/hydrolase-like [Lineus longissimus]|uniref:queuosine 5'-phosphate N-glycosylase/hydrolase-like n=1 Tax=Lineus longissimus TaxID=88925 RepID=UPI002B4EA970
MLYPREAGQFIAENSSDITIDYARVAEVAVQLLESLKRKEFGIKSFKEHELNPKVMDEAAVEWIFVCDLLNFSFWSEDQSKKYVVKYKGKEFTGYWSMCAAMRRASDEGIPITCPSYYANVTRQQLSHIFRSDSEHEIPMFEERLQCLHQAGKCLVEKYNGKFTNCLKQCNQSARQMIDSVPTDFPSFYDVTTFQGQKVGIFKRMQILIADIWCCFEGQGLGTFDDIDTITMFADYRIPQILNYFGILKYSSSLMNKINKGAMFQTGDRDEVEIRGCSIWATELLTQKLKDLMKKDPSMSDVVLNTILVDNYLWDYRREHDTETSVVPFHKIRCIYY